MNVFFLLLASAGLTIIIVDSVIMDKMGLRPLWSKISILKELFSCSMCTGFWSGMLLSAIYLTKEYVFPFALASTIVSFLLERVASLINIAYYKLDKETDNM